MVGEDELREAIDFLVHLHLLRLAQTGFFFIHRFLLLHRLGRISINPSNLGFFEGGSFTVNGRFVQRTLRTPPDEFGAVGMIVMGGCKDYAKVFILVLIIFNLNLKDLFQFYSNFYTE